MFVYSGKKINEISQITEHRVCTEGDFTYGRFSLKSIKYNVSV